MKRQHLIKTSAILPFALCMLAYGAPPTLATPHGDNIMLQRGMNVPVWGSADPGAQIQAAFAGQTQSTTTGAQGKWILKLTPMPASALLTARAWLPTKPQAVSTVQVLPLRCHKGQHWPMQNAGTPNESPAPGFSEQPEAFRFYFHRSPAKKYQASNTSIGVVTVL